MKNNSGLLDEYRLEIKVKNNLLYTKIMEYGYASIPQFCEIEKVPYHLIMSLLNMTKSPLDSKGEMRKSVVAMCEKLNWLPEEIFTQNQIDLELETNKFTKTVQEAEMRYLIENAEPQVLIEELIDKERAFDELEEQLKTLTPREEKVLRMRFGLDPYIKSHTLEETGKQMGNHRERIRQIEAKALRKLRLPNRIAKIQELLAKD